MNRKKIEYKAYFFYAMLVVVGCLFGYFFYKCIATIHLHDFVMHTNLSKSIIIDESQGEIVPVHAEAYPLFHVIVKLLHLCLGISYDLSVAIVLAISAVVSIILFRKLGIFICGKKNEFFLDFVSIGAVIFVTARCWLNDWRFYSLQCAANPLHNPTTLFVRPFAIASFLAFLGFIQQYNNKKNYARYLLLFMGITLLSALAKPSYVFVFLPAMGLYTLYLMIKDRNIKVGIYALIAVLPTIILLLSQRLFMRSSNSITIISVIQVQFGSFANFGIWEVVCVSIVTFPVPILLFSKRMFKEGSYYMMIYLALIIGWVQMFFFTNGPTGDLSWGYDLAVQFSTVVCLAYTRKSDWSSNRTLRNAAYAIFAYQVFSGVLYAFLIMKNGDFWI